MIALMSGMSSYLVWYISTKGEGFLFEPSSWSGKDQYGFGAISILLCGFFGVLYVLTIIKSRE